jgi:hypothetical protein
MTVVRSPDEILVLNKKGQFVISITDEERSEFLRLAREFSESRKLGPPGIRAVYYYLRDKPWSFVQPDYEIKWPDGTTRKRVLWSRWVKETLIKARRLWLGGDHGGEALDPDLFDDDGNPDIQTWRTDNSVEGWANSVPELQLDPWEEQPKRVLVLCEKKGMRSVVQSACRLTRTDFMCCGGNATMKQQSNAGKWAASVKEDELEPVVLYAGDHDMQGVNMDRTWVRDVGEIDSVTRVAITLEQARERGLPMEGAYDKMHLGANISSSQKGQNDKIQKYIDAHGPDMVELDALVADNELALRDILRDAIRGHIDAGIWDERQEEIQGPADRVRSLVNELLEQVETDE